MVQSIAPTMKGFEAAAIAFEKFAHASHNYISTMPWEVRPGPAFSLFNNSPD